MKTISSLLDPSWHNRYRRIANLNIRSSIYDVTNRCNLRCKGCFFFSSGEHHVTEEMDINKIRFHRQFWGISGKKNTELGHALDYARVKCLAYEKKLNGTKWWQFWKWNIWK